MIPAQIFVFGLQELAASDESRCLLHDFVRRCLGSTNCHSFRFVLYLFILNFFRSLPSIVALGKPLDHSSIVYVMICVSSLFLGF